MKFRLSSSLTNFYRYFMPCAMVLANGFLIWLFVSQSESIALGVFFGGMIAFFSIKQILEIWRLKSVFLNNDVITVVENGKETSFDIKNITSFKEIGGAVIKLVIKENERLFHISYLRSVRRMYTQLLMLSTDFSDDLEKKIKDMSAS